MKLKEIKNLERGSFDGKILEMRKELVRINAQVAVGTALKNPGQARLIKKTIARMLTIQNEPKKNDDKKSANKKPEVNKKV